MIHVRELTGWLRRRVRRNPRRRAALGVESLESRYLLADGLHAFAHFEGRFAAPGEVHTIAIQLDRAAFTIPRRGMWLGVELQAPDGSATDFRGAASAAPGRASEMAGPTIIASSPMGFTSWEMAPVHLGGYELAVAAGEAMGEFAVSAYLVGDVNGDYRVSRDDLRAIRSAIRQRQAVGSTDVDRNGATDRHDVAIAKRNLGGSTEIRPLGVELDLSPRFDSGEPHDRITRWDSVMLAGQTTPAALVGFDHDRDGQFDDTPAQATDSGEFTLPAVLEEGTNDFSVLVQDSFGQRASANIAIELDTIPPAAPAVEFALQPAGDWFGLPATSDETVEIAGQAEPNLSVHLSAGSLTTTADATGWFEFRDVPLAVGPNYFYVASRDAAGNWSHSSAMRVFRDGPVVGCEPRAVAPSLFAIRNHDVHSGFSVGDVDADGDIDIVAPATAVFGGEAKPSLAVMTNRGDGTFLQRCDHALFGFAGATALGDLDGDGDLDVVALRQNYDDRGYHILSVLIGNGDGTFVRGDEYEAASADAIALGDVDGDGDLDAVTAHAILPNNGDGTFGAGRVIESNPKARAVALGDVDGDGDLDIVTANDDYSVGESASVSLGNGKGGFVARVGLDAGVAARSVALSDMNGDGLTEIILGTARGAVMFTAADAGSFARSGEVAFVIEEFGTDASGVAAADVDRDGDMDLVAITGYSATVAVALNNGMGSFGLSAVHLRVTDSRVVTLADMNSDGNPDLVVINNGIVVVAGRGDGTFDAPADLRIDGWSKAVAIGDLDVVTANYDDGDDGDQPGNNVSVLLNRGDGKLRLTIDYPVDETPLGVALGDVDGDGDLDVVTANYGGCFYNSEDEEICGRRGTVSLLLGRGDGRFEARRDVRVGAVATDVALGDLDRDGDLDLAVTTGTECDYDSTAHSYLCENPGRVVVLLGDEAGGFATRRQFDVGDNPNSLALGDLDNDGDLDIVTTNYLSASGVTVLRGRGNGTFGNRTDLPVTTETTVALGDMDEDGLLDIVFTDWYLDAVTVVSLSGDGLFTTLGSFALQSYAGQLAVGDMNRDDHLDVVASMPGENRVSVLLGRGDGSIGDLTDYVVGPGPFGLALGDLDGDSDLDFVTANYDAATISTRLNTIIDHPNPQPPDPPPLPLGVQIGLDPRSDTGVPGDLITRLERVTLVGQTAPGADVAFDLEGDWTRDPRWITADRHGRFQTTAVLIEGANYLTVFVRDPFGQHVQQEIVVLRDSTAPRLQFGLNPADVATCTGPDVTVHAPVTILGDSDPGTRVTLQQTRAAVTTGDSGAFSFTGVPLEPGRNQLTVSAIDVAGNETVFQRTITRLDEGSVDEGDLFPSRIVAVGSFNSGFVTGDLDGDGDADIVAPDGLLWFSGGDGTFAASTTTGLGAWPSVAAAVGDLDGDGDLDIVGATSSYQPKLAVLLGRGDGTFEGSADAELAAGTTAVALGDLNGDGRLDVVTANSRDGQTVSNSVSVLLGLGGGTFEQRRDYAVGSRPMAVALGDLDHDGDLDIVTGNYNYTDAEKVTVLHGRGDGTFDDPTDYRSNLPTYDATLGDLDGDGVLDIVTANHSRNSVSVWLGTGDGSYRPPVDWYAGTAPWAVAAGDVDRDGDLDIIAGDVGHCSYDPTQHRFVCAQDGAVSVLLGNGDGTFGERREFAAPDGPTEIVLGDVDRDGDLDIVTANSGGRGYSGESVSVLLGAGDGSFADRIDYVLGSVVTSVALGDLDADGDLDMVAMRAGVSSGIIVLAGSGDGRFAQTEQYAAWVGGGSVVLGDLNEDGALDVVFPGFGLVMPGLGNGRFGSSIDQTTNVAWASDLALGDVNADGHLDLFAANYGDRVSVFIGTGNGRFCRETTYDVGMNPEAVVLGDLDGDGDLDFVTANYFGGFSPRLNRTV